jgi:hypothetical protein
MGSPQDHAGRRLACVEGFLPAGRAQAPTVTRLRFGSTISADYGKRGRRSFIVIIIIIV